MKQPALTPLQWQVLEAVDASTVVACGTVEPGTALAAAVGRNPQGFHRTAASLVDRGLVMRLDTTQGVGYYVTVAGRVTLRQRRENAQRRRVQFLIDEQRNAGH